MDTTEKKKSRDFNIYYLNFSKVYEIAMMINNVILTQIETDKSSSFEEQYGFTSSISAQGTKQFLDGIKASISADARETSTSSSKVVESLDVKTTKSILLRRIIEQCASVTLLDNSVEGDLVKVDRVKLELLNEESLRQFLILRRDALKGMRVEGMEVNNLVSSMLQDYAYILKGLVYDESMKEPVSEIIIKIPMEIQSEFIVLPLEKPCNIRRFRLSNPQTVCTFPCFFPYGLKQGKDFYSPLTTLSSSRAELRFASLVEWA